MAQTLESRRIGDELLTLVRRGDQFRIVSLSAAAGARIRTAAATSRWRFRSGDVARRAFHFAVASERVWAARLAGRRSDGLALAADVAGRAFRLAALDRDDLPEAMVGQRDPAGDARRAETSPGRAHLDETIAAEPPHPR